MLLELARQYADIIQAIEVERFRSVGASYEFRALITLHDGSQLFVKDYLGHDPNFRSTCEMRGEPDLKTQRS